MNDEPINSCISHFESPVNLLVLMAVSSSAGTCTGAKIKKLYWSFSSLFRGAGAGTAVLQS
jgi:hypothetical protein